MMKIHIIAPAEIKTVFDLEGKRIEAPKDVGLYSAKAIFSRLHINVTYDSTYLNDDTGALQQVIDGKADAFATDDILLYGLIARHKSQDKFRVTGDYLSYDPYGIMFRRGEPQLAAVVERTFRKLGSNRDLVPLYNKWFVARLPTGEKLNVPISPQLEEAFKALDDTEGASN